LLKVQVLCREGLADVTAFSDALTVSCELAACCLLWAGRVLSPVSWPRGRFCQVTAIGAVVVRFPSEDPGRGRLMPAGDTPAWA